MVNELHCPVWSAFLDLLQEDFCVSPRDRNARNERDVFSVRTSTVFVGRVSRCRRISGIQLNVLY